VCERERERERERAVAVEQITSSPFLCPGPIFLLDP